MVVGAIGEENQILLRKPLLPNNVSPPFYIYLKESFWGFQSVQTY
jgi:hypothetical protein